MTSVDAVAAFVDGEPVTVAEVEARLAQVRRSPLGALLPDPRTAEGRNARRWVTQLVCAERLVEAELGPATGAPAPLALDRALGVGGVAAAVLAARPDALHVIASTPPDEATVRGYWARNPDRYADRGLPLDDARPAITALLQRVATDTALAAWLDVQLRRRVTLQPGFEHPADPRHPDATHRH